MSGGGDLIGPIMQQLGHKRHLERFVPSLSIALKETMAKTMGSYLVQRKDSDRPTTVIITVTSASLRTFPLGNIPSN